MKAPIRERYRILVRIIAVKTLREFWERHPDAEQPLRGWYTIASRNGSGRPTSKRDYRNMGFIANNRVVFNTRETLTVC